MINFGGILKEFESNSLKDFVKYSPLGTEKNKRAFLIFDGKL
jgi:hypothetical protein